MKARRIAIASIITALLTSFLVLPTTANAAAARSCNRVASFDARGGPSGSWINMPAYRDAGGGGDFRCYLAPGASNAAVKELQAAINICYAGKSGIPRIAQDGVYGAGTKSALMQVQRYINAEIGSKLATDGLYGPSTATHMRFTASKGDCMRVWA